MDTSKKKHIQYTVNVIIMFEIINVINVTHITFNPLLRQKSKKKKSKK